MEDTGVYVGRVRRYKGKWTPELEIEGGYQTLCILV